MSGAVLVDWASCGCYSMRHGGRSHGKTTKGGRGEWHGSHAQPRQSARPLFHKTEEFRRTFERMMVEAIERSHIKLYAYCLMPNHWHRVVGPEVDGEMGRVWPVDALWRGAHGTTAEKSLLASWPVPRRPHWIDFVAAPLTDKEQKEMQRSISRGVPFGDKTWVTKTVRRLGLESALRARGRPKKLPKSP